MDIYNIFNDTFTIINVPLTMYGYFKLYRKFILYRDKRKQLSNVLKNKTDWTIIVPKFENNFQKTEDTLAAIKIKDFCKNLNVQCVIRDDCYPFPTDKNIFFICGPKRNKKVNKYYSGFQVEMMEDARGKYIIKDHLLESTYHSTMHSNENDKRDYAILSRKKTPDGRYFIFCMGITALGTLGAAYMLTLPQFHNDNTLKNDNFESVLSVPYIDEYFTIDQLKFEIPMRC